MSVTKLYPMIGQTAGDGAGIIDLANADTTEYVAGTADWTVLSALTGMSSCGYINCNVGGTTYRIPILLDT